MIALLLLGCLQLSQWMAARDVLHHAASRGARAKTVGFNRWMVEKVIDVSTIPTAGRMISPAHENIQAGLRARLAGGNAGSVFDYALRTTPVSAQAALEHARIPEYLAAETRARARYLLDYEDWPRIGHWAHSTAQSDAESQDSLQVRVFHDYRLWVPMHRTFYAADEVELVADAFLESHYPLYIQDLDW